MKRKQSNRTKLILGIAVSITIINVVVICFNLYEPEIKNYDLSIQPKIIIPDVPEKEQIERIVQRIDPYYLRGLNKIEFFDELNLNADATYYPISKTIVVRLDNLRGNTLRRGENEYERFENYLMDVLTHEVIHHLFELRLGDHSHKAIRDIHETHFIFH